MVYGDIYIYGGGAHGHGCFRALINVVEIKTKTLYIFCSENPSSICSVVGEKSVLGLNLSCKNVNSFGKCYIYIYIY
jgi:hypothetical protein